MPSLFNRLNQIVQHAV